MRVIVKDLINKDNPPMIMSLDKWIKIINENTTEISVKLIKD